MCQKDQIQIVFQQVIRFNSFILKKESQEVVEELMEI